MMRGVGFGDEVVRSWGPRWNLWDPTSSLLKQDFTSGTGQPLPCLLCPCISSSFCFEQMLMFPVRFIPRMGVGGPQNSSLRALLWGYQEPLPLPPSILI